MEEKMTTEELEKEAEKEAEVPVEESESTKEEKKEKKQKKTAALEKEIEALKAELEETNDKYLRVAAEYDNFRRRSQKEKEGIYSEATADSVKELLPLFDNLERAAVYEDAEQIAEGFKMILKTIPDVLSKMKVETFGEVGETFDPNIHNAIMHEENELYGESEITDVFQKGYRIGDKIIRFAMVKVAN